MKPKPITIVGCGPGGLEYLTHVAHEAITQADVLIGARRLLELFPEAAGERIAVGADIEAALNAIERCNDGRAIAVLVTGDPGVCSLARPVIRRFGLDACRVIPGISSVQVACARLGVEWHDARIISAHGAVPALDRASLAAERKIAVLAGGRESFVWIADLATGLGEDWKIFIGEDLTLAGERLREVSTEDLRVGAFSSRSIVVLLRESRDIG